MTCIQLAKKVFSCIVLLSNGRVKLHCSHRQLTMVLARIRRKGSRPTSPPTRTCQRTVVRTQLQISFLHLLHAEEQVHIPIHLITHTVRPASIHHDKVGIGSLPYTTGSTATERPNSRTYCSNATARSSGSARPKPVAQFPNLPPGVLDRKGQWKLLRQHRSSLPHLDAHLPNE